MTRSNRHRVDTITAATQARPRSNIVPPPHIELAEGDWPHWRALVAEFASAEMTDHLLEMVAFLARAMADLDREQRALRDEGFTVTRDNGTTVENPRARSVQSLTGQILSLRRSLALHARAKAGETRDVAKRRSIAKTTESDLDTDDDLIARRYQ